MGCLVTQMLLIPLTGRLLQNAAGGVGLTTPTHPLQPVGHLCVCVHSVFSCFTSDTCILYWILFSLLYLLNLFRIYFIYVFIIIYGFFKFII